MYLLFQVSQPFELLGMDLIGKLTETASGHKLHLCYDPLFHKVATGLPTEMQGGRRSVTVHNKVCPSV